MLFANNSCISVILRKRRGYLDEIRLKKKRRQQRKLLFIFALIIIFTAAAIYSLFYSQLFSVNTFKVDNYHELNQEAFDKLINNYLDTRLLFGLIYRKSNYLFISKDKVLDLIQENFPQIKGASFNLNLFKNTLDIALEERIAMGSWCFSKNEKCYFFDPDGYLFKEAPFTSSGQASPKFFNKNLGGQAPNNLVVRDENSARGIKEYIKDKEMLNKIIEANKVLRALDFVNYSNFYIPENSFSDFWVKTAEGWDIYLDKSVNLEEQFIGLRELLNKKISVEKRSSLQYMDLRIQSRIYYK